MRRLFIATALLLGLASAALAQETRVHVRGTIAGLDGSVLTLAGPANSTTKVNLAPDVRISYVVKVDPATIVAGTNIGTAAVPQPDGTLKALEIHVFAPGPIPGGGGSTPYDLGPTSTMTNGTVDTIGAVKVDKVDARTFTVKYQGGEKQVVVPPNVPIVGYAPADKSALVPGAHVIVFGVKKDDGSITVGAVAVGKDGLVPPM